MKPLITLSMLVFLAACPMSKSWGQVYLTRSGKLTFVSDAPLETITASSDNVQGAINISDRRFAFKIENKSFIGFNSPLQQEHFYENYMETDKYGHSTFQGKIIEDLDNKNPDLQHVRAKGILSIHGVEVERIIPATVLFTEKGIQVESDFTVRLEDHDIRIPNVVNQKIAETVDVRIQALLKEKKD
ncbi:MAG: YceI family protein [bacterium]